MLAHFRIHLSNVYMCLHILETKTQRPRPKPLIAAPYGVNQDPELAWPSPPEPNQVSPTRRLWKLAKQRGATTRIDATAAPMEEEPSGTSQPTNSLSALGRTCFVDRHEMSEQRDDGAFEKEVPVNVVTAGWAYTLRRIQTTYRPGTQGIPTLGKIQN